MSNHISCEYFDMAMKAGRKSSLIQKHGTIIIRQNEVVAVGTNNTKPMHKFSFHSEIDALFKLKGKSKRYMEGCTMLVVRTSATSDGTKYSRPCAACTAAIEKSGIKKVFYSVANGLPGMECEEME